MGGGEGQALGADVHKSEYLIVGIILHQHTNSPGVLAAEGQFLRQSRHIQGHRDLLARLGDGIKLVRGTQIPILLGAVQNPDPREIIIVADGQGQIDAAVLFIKLGLRNLGAGVIQIEPVAELLRLPACRWGGFNVEIIILIALGPWATVQRSLSIPFPGEAAIPAGVVENGGIASSRGIVVGLSASAQVSGGPEYVPFVIGDALSEACHVSQQADLGD